MRDFLIIVLIWIIFTSIRTVNITQAQTDQIFRRTPVFKPHTQEFILKSTRTIVERPEMPFIIRARVTAYSPLDNKSGMCADDNPTVTSTGVHPGKQYAAVDPARIPYGTIMDIPDYGVVIAADTGGYLRNHEDICIDVYMDTYEEAINWGVQYLDVTIVYHNEEDKK